MVQHIVQTDYSYLMGEARKYLLVALVSILTAFPFLFVPMYGVFISGGLLLFSVNQLGKWFSYVKGASGEKKVSKALRRLDDEFYLLEDIVLYPQSGNIDHIVLGHNGIFVIETKNYSGIVRCFGDTWYHASNPNTMGMRIESVSLQVKKNAIMLNAFLKNHIVGNFVNRLFVKPIIVFTNGSMQISKKNPTVTITTSKKLSKLIMNLDTGIYFSNWELERMSQVIKSKSVQSI